MKSFLAIMAIAFLVLAAPAFAGFQMLVVGTDTAVAIDASTKCTSPLGSSVAGNIECTVGPIKTNAIVVTWTYPVVTPTATSGHELAAGTSITLKGLATDKTNEVNSFRAIASSATSTVPVSCVCSQ